MRRIRLLSLSTALCLIFACAASSDKPKMVILPAKPKPDAPRPEAAPAPSTTPAPSSPQPGRLSETEAESLIRSYNFYDSRRNGAGGGIAHQFRLVSGGQVVIDDATSLMWQRSGSTQYKLFDETRAYLDSLNTGGFGGYSDWRLPTLAEAMSLMMPYLNESGCYIDPVFDGQQRWIWTSDMKSGIEVWIVYYSYGYAHFDHTRYAGSYCRAVRNK